MMTINSTLMPLEHRIEEVPNTNTTNEAESIASNSATFATNPNIFATKPNTCTREEPAKVPHRPDFGVSLALAQGDFILGAEPFLVRSNARKCSAIATLQFPSVEEASEARSLLLSQTPEDGQSAALSLFFSVQYEDGSPIVLSRYKGLHANEFYLHEPRVHRAGSEKILIGKAPMSGSEPSASGVQFILTTDGSHNSASPVLPAFCWLEMSDVTVPTQVEVKVLAVVPLTFSL